MAAGDTMQGRRRDDGPPWEFEPGDYGVRVDAATSQRLAWVVTPNGNGPARLEGWALTEHDDGTITVSPSIMAHEQTGLGQDGEPTTYPAWHGFLERGVWREV